MFQQANANNVKSCEISLAPKAARIIEDTFYNNQKLAEKFISVLMEDNNLFLGSTLLGYFDRAMVNQGILKSENGMETTALTTNKFASQNKKSLKRFENTNTLDQISVANEMWNYLQVDLELDKPEVVGGKDVFVRLTEKSESTGALKGLDETQKNQHIVKLVKLRSTLKEVLNQPGGQNLIRAFIVNSLPFHARFLSELQFHGQDRSNREDRFSELQFAFNTMIFPAATAIGFESVLGQAMFIAASVGGLAHLFWTAGSPNKVQRVSAKLNENQCSVCQLLAKGMRTQLEKSGFFINETLNSNGKLEVRSLDVPKLPSPKFEKLALEEKLELSHPLKLSEINKFGLNLIHQAQELSKEAETLETSYESGISHIIKGKELSIDELRSRLQFRYEQIQRIQSYLEGSTEQSEMVRTKLVEAIEYVIESVDTFANKDQHMNNEVAKSMESQTKTLALAEKKLSIINQKLISLASGIIRESNLINAIYLELNEKSQSPQLIKEYMDFISERRDLNVEEVMQTLQLDH